MDWLRRNKKPSKDAESLDELATAFGELDNICKKETGAGLALHQCPNKCDIEKDGEKATLVVIGALNKPPKCPVCESAMVPV